MSYLAGSFHFSSFFFPPKLYLNPCDSRPLPAEPKAALVAFLAEIEDEVNIDTSQSGSQAPNSAASGASSRNASASSSSLSSELREHRLGERLKAYREAVGGCRGDSFETISSVGANAAVNEALTNVVHLFLTDVAK